MLLSGTSGGTVWCHLVPVGGQYTDAHTGTSERTVWCSHTIHLELIPYIGTDTDSHTIYTGTDTDSHTVHQN